MSFSPYPKTCPRKCYQGPLRSSINQQTLYSQLSVDWLKKNVSVNDTYHTTWGIYTSNTYNQILTLTIGDIQVYFKSLQSAQLHLADISRWKPFLSHQQSCFKYNTAMCTNNRLRISCLIFLLFLHV